MENIQARDFYIQGFFSLFFFQQNYLFSSQPRHHKLRHFHPAPQLFRHLSHGRPVDDAMIGAPAEMRHFALDQAIVRVEGRYGAGLPDAQDGDLVRDDDGRDVGAADGADVAHRDGAAGEVGRREGSGLGEGLQTAQLGGDVADGEGRDVFDVRDQEAVRGVHGDADVVLVAPDQLRRVLSVPDLDAGVQERELFQRERHGFDDEGEEGKSREGWRLHVDALAGGR